MKKPVRPKKTNAKRIRELEQLIEHANELVRTFGQNAQSCTSAALIAFYTHRNQVMKRGR